MKANIELENVEKDALQILSEVYCIGISCVKCPLNFKLNDYSICIKGISQSLLEDYLNKE